MNSPTQETKASRTASRSSITVSDKIVCEDEACIGKGVNPAAAPSADTVQPDNGDNKSPGTRISIGGKVVCSDDACIGKK